MNHQRSAGASAVQRHHLDTSTDCSPAPRLQRSPRPKFADALRRSPLEPSEETLKPFRLVRSNQSSVFLELEIWHQPTKCRRIGTIQVNRCWPR